MLFTRCLLFSLLIIFNRGCTNNNTHCEYISDGKGLSKGIKAKINYPCDWRARVDTRPGVVQYFSSPSGKIGFSLQVHDIGPDYVLTKEEAKAALQEYGNPILVKDARLKGRDVIESISETTFEDPNLGFAYSKILAFTFIHQGKGVSLSFSSQSLDKELSDKQFESFQKLFRSMASEATFY